MCLLLIQDRERSRLEAQCDIVAQEEVRAAAGIQRINGVQRGKAAQVIPCASSDQITEAASPCEYGKLKVR